MRYLILSDIHGNWDALAAVQRHLRQTECDAVLVLGDLVGYGADPDRVVSAVRRLPEPVYTVRGNHDRVVTDLRLAAGFNEAAQRAARWTAEHIEESNLRYLGRLPRGPMQVAADIAICHGSPIDEDDYLLSRRRRRRGVCRPLRRRSPSSATPTSRRRSRWPPTAAASRGPGWARARWSSIRSVAICSTRARSASRGTATRGPRA